jgi:hypothetical protein
MTDTISRIMKIRDGMTPDPLARAIVEREIAALQRHSSPDSASVQALTAAMSLISQKITKLDWSRDECRRKGQAVYVSNLTEQIEAWGDHLSAIKELMNATPVTDAAATPSNPTACPTSDPSWPESQPCSICGAFGPWFDTPQNGECVEATGGDAMADEVQAATPPRYIVDGLPELPDDDADFTPYLARKIIAKYQELLRGVAQAPTAPDVELERDMWIAAAGGEAEIGKREAAKAEALYLLVNEAQAALVEFKRWCRTDISRKSWDALHALEDVLSRPVGPNIPLSDLANDLQQASSVSSTEGK